MADKKYIGRFLYILLFSKKKKKNKKIGLLFAVTVGVSYLCIVVGLMVYNLLGFFS